MFTGYFIEFKTQQIELHRKAAHQRLVRSFENALPRKHHPTPGSGRQPAAFLRPLVNQPRAAH